MDGVSRGSGGRVQVELGRQPPGSFPAGAVVGRHDLHRKREELFCDEALVELLDRVPRNRIFAISSGTNPAKPGVGELASTEGVPGKELFRAMQRGCIWLNITQVDLIDARFAALLRELQAAVAEAVPGFHPQGGSAAVVISAPNAKAEYHIDGPPSLLWHLRGRKRLWVYPAMDWRFVAREQLEEILAGTGHEYGVHQRWFDAHASVIDVQGGELIAWPQNAPHHVENQGTVNVSLATDYFTAESRQRTRVFAANRALRNLGYAPRTFHTTGLRAWAKVALHRGLLKVGLDRPVNKRHDPPRLRVDPDTELGVREVA